MDLHAGVCRSLVTDISRDSDRLDMVAYARNCGMLETVVGLPSAPGHPGLQFKTERCAGKSHDGKE